MIIGTYACRLQVMKIGRELAEVIVANFCVCNSGLPEIVDTVGAGLRCRM